MMDGKKYWEVYRKAFIKNEKGIKNLVIKNDEIKVFKELNKLIIVFKGSNNAKDWKDNIKFCKDKNTHEGFLYIINAIELNLIYIIKKYNLVQIVLVGYSKGGALALEMADRLGDLSYKVTVYTYGQPAIWTELKMNRIRKKNKFKYFRVFFQRDIVVKCLNFFYEHLHQNEIKLKSKWWHWLPFMGIKVHLSYDDYYKSS